MCCTATAAGNGGYDIWVVKIDATGNKLWESSHGGTGTEEGRAMIRNGSGYILAGLSDSGVSGNKYTPGYGGRDMWVLGLNYRGQRLWELPLGGTADDSAFGLSLTTSGSILVTGTSASGVSGNKTAAGYGGADYWMLALSVPDPPPQPSVELNELPPQVEVLQPVSLVATVSGGGTVSKVQFFVGDQQIWEDATGPEYTATWLPLYYTTNQTIALTAKATLQDGSPPVTSDAKNVEVTNRVAKLEKPLRNLPYGTAANISTESVVHNTGSIFDNIERKANESASPVLRDIRVGNRGPESESGSQFATSTYFMWDDFEFEAILTESEASTFDLSKTGSDPNRRFFFVAYADSSGPGVFLPLDQEPAIELYEFPEGVINLKVPDSFLHSLGLIPSSTKVRLFRKPDFSQDKVKDRLVGSDAAHTPLSLAKLEAPGGEKKLIIMVHGWNRGHSENQIHEAEFLGLGQGLENSIGANSDWIVLGYNWGEDTMTGSFASGDETFDISESGSRAAALGYMHGIALGDYLISISGSGKPVSKIQFMAHSAGTWVVYGALQKLMDLGIEGPETQVTLFDPYMPSETWAKNSLLGKRFWNKLATAVDTGSRRIRLIENYYTKDITGSGTKQVFEGSWARNADVSSYYWSEPSNDGDATNDEPTDYAKNGGDGHSGPIRWYTDSITRHPIDFAKQFIDPKGWSVPSMGWDNSLFTDEKTAGYSSSSRQSSTRRTSGNVANTTRGITMARSGTVAGLAGKTVVSIISTVPASTSDASLSDQVTIPAGGAIFSFDFAFDAASPGDSLALIVNGQTLWTYAGTDYVNQGLQGFLTTGPIDVSAFAGQTITWEIRLQAGSGQNVVALVDNIYIYNKPFNFTRTNAPVITTAAQTNTVAAGSLFQFSPTVFGLGPIAFQWLKNGSPLPAKTNQILSFTAATGDVGDYQLRASNIFATVTSALYRLEVDATPGLIAITAQPTNALVNAGQPVTFTVGATGANPLAYQWFKDGETLASATNSSLSIDSAGATDAGLYWLLITNSVGETVSQPASLDLITTVAPTISVQPIPAVVALGSTLAFSVIAYGDPEPGYQWYHGSNALGDATNAVLVLSGVGTNRAGQYSVIITNSAGSVTSLLATLTVNRLDPVLSWAVPEAITYGTLLGSAQLNASSQASGSITYDPDTNTRFEVGTHVLQATFTPSDPSVYSNATATVNLTVNPASLAITPGDVARVYGQTNPVFTGVLSGLKNGDNVTGNYSTTATTNSPPGVYPIKVLSLSDPGGKVPNYVVTTNQGVLTVTRANLEVVAENRSRLYGQTNPVFTAVFSGFANGETLLTSDLGGAPSFSTAADTNSPVGAYPILVTSGSLTSAHYQFAFTNGVLAITAPTEITLSLPQLNAGQFQFVYGTAAGAIYVIETSTNLTAWEPLSTNTALGTTISFTDTNSVGHPRRFYRLLLLP